MNALVMESFVSFYWHREIIGTGWGTLYFNPLLDKQRAAYNASRTNVKFTGVSQ